MGDLYHRTNMTVTKLHYLLTFKVIQAIIVVNRLRNRLTGFELEMIFNPTFNMYL